MNFIALILYIKCIISLIVLKFLVKNFFNMLFNRRTLSINSLFLSYNRIHLIDIFIKAVFSFEVLMLIIYGIIFIFCSTYSNLFVLSHRSILDNFSFDEAFMRSITSIRYQLYSTFLGTWNSRILLIFGIFSIQAIKIICLFST